MLHKIDVINPTRLTLQLSDPLTLKHNNPTRSYKTIS